MRRCLRIGGAALLALFAGRSLVRAEAPLTVDQAVAEALQNHPSLKAAGARVDQAEASHRAVWDAYVPQLGGYAGAQVNQVSGNTTTTTPGGLFGGGETITQSFDENDTRFVAGATLEELLYDFGGFSADRRSTDSAHRAQLGALEAQRNEVTLNVKVSYYNLLRANRLLRYNSETVERRRARAQRIGELSRRGVRGRKDVLQAQLDLAGARLNLARSQSQITDVEAAFLDAIGQQTRSNRKLVDDVSLKPVRLTLEQAVERSLTLRPELAQTRFAIESQEAVVDSVRASYLPRISAFGSVSSITPTGSSDLDQLTVFTGGVSARVPTGWIFNRARRDRAAASLAELRARELELKQSVTLDVSRHYTSLFEAVERTRITQELANDALANFRETQTRYRKGRASISESTDAYTFLYDARVSFIQALYDAKIAEARLERAIGASL